ncbi:SAM-dependent methyltransferase [Roseospira visakhapatnamensis]|uniref:Cyclopropane-fatty-acyl-phospholipid synthase n=1 Tax=Roseospira visakhapatnamensis TaxID=390880 RepID=A0A7W6W9W2_9PROT|nr:cyclopropane-fatty-acyl-phospholipid synthase family protein [Roseospira visakhapatnamensis]MBB4265832.1 cyclopropane-fatty-acyl-phospholipid synthase [Roseospira visakhapatnamensis]
MSDRSVPASDSESTPASWSESARVPRSDHALRLALAEGPSAGRESPSTPIAGPAAPRSSRRRTWTPPGADALSLAGLNLLLGRLRRGRLTLIRPDRSERVFEGAAPGPEAAVILRDPRAARRLVLGGAVGFGEAYVDGLWDTPDLEAVLHLAAANNDGISVGRTGAALSHWLRGRNHRRNANTRDGSRRNIAYHYDLGNDFYAAWLDPSMTYSAALWETPDQRLEDAQTAKIRRLCRTLDLTPGQRVLEIGCGWGGFAEIAAREFGCHVTGLTLSREQLDWARGRIAAAGLSDRVDLRLQDYRDVTGTFDAVASIEMFEAVGQEHWPLFFERLGACLRSGGRAGLQVITIAEDRFEEYRAYPDFIQTHVFPGGMLPTTRHLAEGLTAAGLTVGERLAFGADYARTLGLWRDAFLTAWPGILDGGRGFDERFRRLWTYYLGYCKVGFESGAIDVVQIAAARP